MKRGVDLPRYSLASLTFDKVKLKSLFGPKRTCQMSHIPPKLPFQKVERAIEAERHEREQNDYLNYHAQKAIWGGMRVLIDRLKYLEWLVYSGLRLPLVQSEDDIADTAYALFREYVQFKLHRRGMGSHLNCRTPKKGNSEFSLVSYELQSMGIRLESIYPGLYSNISRQLNITMTSEKVVENLCQDLADRIFDGGITWAKIVSYYAVTSSLVIECYEECNGIYIHTVMRFIQEYVRMNLAKWIQRHGGWRDVIREFRRRWLLDYPLILVVIVVVWFLILYFFAILARKKLTGHSYLP